MESGVAGWSAWREAPVVCLAPRHLQRTLPLAVVVGSLLFAINHLDTALRDGLTTAVLLKAATTYLVPFAVSNYGLLLAARRRETATALQPPAATLQAPGRKQVESTTTLEQLAQAVERTPLVAEGKSGSRLERVVLADGVRVVVKTIAPGSDWIMRATGDEGRAAMLWTSGLLSQVPAVVDPAVIDAVPLNGGSWLLVMRDDSDLLVAPHACLTRADSRRILDAAAALHACFWAHAVNVPWLCTLTARYTILSPATSRREEQGSDEVPKMLSRGWQRFAEAAPADVAEAVLAILEDPARLAAQLERYPMTLIHGDLKLGNLGLPRDRVVMLDWALAGPAPPAVEVAWYLAVNWSRIDATREQILEDFRGAEGAHHNEDALRLALLGGLVQLGWDKAILATEHPDETIRRREAEDLAWWVARSREALDTWSPV